MALFRRIQVSMSLPRFAIVFSMSFSSGYGFRLEGNALQLSSAHQLVVSRPTEELSRRAQAEWNTTYMNSELNQVEVCLFEVSANQVP